MKQEQRISNGVKKLSITFIICLLFLFIPVSLLAEDDFWTIDDILDDTINNTENSEKRIYLETLELYWSANSYVPFGYQGRILPTKGSLVTVSAFLEISEGNPRNLKYSWFLDDVFQETKSGYGRDDFQFGIRRSNNASHTVQLKVFNESRSFFAEESVTIPITRSEVVIYSKAEAQINLPYTASVKDFDLITDEESSFLALPYFFNIKNLEDLEFNWTFANKTYKESSLTANVFGLKIINKETGGLLEQTLKVVAANKRWPEQTMQKTIKLNIY